MLSLMVRISLFERSNHYIKNQLYFFFSDCMLQLYPYELYQNANNYGCRGKVGFEPDGTLYSAKTHVIEFSN